MIQWLLSRGRAGATLWHRREHCPTPAIFRQEGVRPFIGFARVDCRHCLPCVSLDMHLRRVDHAGENKALRLVEQIQWLQLTQDVFAFGFGCIVAELHHYVSNNMSHSWIFAALHCMI